MPGIVRMIENGDADGPAVYGAAVIAPGSAFAPGRPVAYPFAVHNVTGRLALIEFVGRQPHRLVQPQGHGAFLRVSEHKVAMRRVDRDLEIEETLLWPIVNEQSGVVGAKHFSFRCEDGGVLLD